MSSDNGGSGFATGLILGGIIGAVVGILIAPKEGSQTRSELIKPLKEANKPPSASSCRDKALNMRENVGPAVETAITNIGPAVDAVRKQIDPLIDQVNSRLKSDAEVSQHEEDVAKT